MKPFSNENNIPLVYQLYYFQKVLDQGRWVEDSFLYYNYGNFRSFLKGRGSKGFYSPVIRVAITRIRLRPLLYFDKIEPAMLYLISPSGYKKAKARLGFTNKDLNQTFSDQRWKAYQTMGLKDKPIVFDSAYHAQKYISDFQHWIPFHQQRIQEKEVSFETEILRILERFYQAPFTFL